MRRLLLASNDFGLILSSNQLELFEEYFSLINEWKSKVNLTNITEREKVINLHFVDSLSAILALENRDLNGQIVLDMGTGAGFPSVPLKIAFPSMKLNIIESNQKKISFLKDLIEKLRLRDVFLNHGRAEDFAHDPSMREKFDLVFARSVAKLNVLSELTLPFLAIEGKAIFHKRFPIDDELENSKSSINILGGSNPEIFPVNHASLPDRSILVKISKTTPSPLKYPRRVGIPNKRPLSG